MNKCKSCKWYKLLKQCEYCCWHDCPLDYVIKPCEEYKKKWWILKPMNKQLDILKDAREKTRLEKMEEVGHWDKAWGKDPEKWSRNYGFNQAIKQTEEKWLEYEK